MKIELREAASWMWNNRSNGHWLRPMVLTPANIDPTAPRLIVAEAESLFMTLLEEKLIFAVALTDGPAYYINSTKEKEWNEFFNSHNVFYSLLKKLFSDIWVFLRWLKGNV